MMREGWSAGRAGRSGERQSGRAEGHAGRRGQRGDCSMLAVDV